MENKTIIENLKRDYRREVEIRSATQIEPELNDSGEVTAEGYLLVEGKAVTFNDATVLFSHDGNDYHELILPESFNEADISDVFLKFNHESSFMAVARTKNKTLELDVRDDGVYIRAKLSPKLTGARDLYEAIRQGLIDKMSFAFSIQAEEYNEVTRTWTIHKIGKVFDVAAVENPAYDNTFIHARRMQDAEALSKRAEAQKRIAVQKAYIRGLTNSSNNQD